MEISERMALEKDAAENMGVPLAKTCILLDFKVAYLCWIKDEQNNHILFDSDYDNDNIPQGYEFVAFAPTLQEILKAIFDYNKHLVISVQPNYIDLGLDKININEGKQSITFTWENENLAECAAQVYLELITYT